MGVAMRGKLSWTASGGQSDSISREGHQSARPWTTRAGRVPDVCHGTRTRNLHPWGQTSLLLERLLFFYSEFSLFTVVYVCRCLKCLYLVQSVIFCVLLIVCNIPCLVKRNTVFSFPLPPFVSLSLFGWVGKGERVAEISHDSPTTKGRERKKGIFSRKFDGCFCCFFIRLQLLSVGSPLSFRVQMANCFGFFTSTTPWLTKVLRVEVSPQARWCRFITSPPTPAPTCRRALPPPTSVWSRTTSRWSAIGTHSPGDRCAFRPAADDSQNVWSTRGVRGKLTGFLFPPLSRSLEVGSLLQRSRMKLWSKTGLAVDNHAVISFSRILFRSSIRV